MWSELMTSSLNTFDSGVFRVCVWLARELVFQLYCKFWVALLRVYLLLLCHSCCLVQFKYILFNFV